MKKNSFEWFCIGATAMFLILWLTAFLNGTTLVI